MRHRPGLGSVVSALVMLVLFVGLAGCGGRPAPNEAPGAVSGTTGTAAPAAAAPVREDAPGSSAVPEYLPSIVPHSGYVGSASCRECHADEHASWQRSYHRTMTQLPSRASVLANFKNVALTNDNTRFTLLNDGDRFGVRVEYLTAPAPGEPVREPTQIILGLVTGSHHMQVFWLPNGMGNCQVGFPFTWLIPEQRWVPRTMTFLRPPEAGHGADGGQRPEVWNALCIRCHATGMEPHFRPSQGQIATRVADLGISCEACHGPAQSHVEFARRQAGQSKAAISAVTQWHMVQPARLDPQRGSEVCGFCHSMKWLDPKEHWFDEGFSYRPGDALEKSTPIIRRKSAESPGPLVEYLRSNPDLMRDFFWDDGMIRVSGREYNGLIESPCYQGGKFSCFSCHSLHQSEPDDQLSATRQDHRACTQCHARFLEPAALSQHTHHGTGSTGSDCYNCHMPHTTYGVLSAIRSHQVSSPRVAAQQSTGRPNACNLCHLDQTLAWTGRWLRDWYQQPLPALGPEESSLAEGVRLSLAGDAGQRVLLAWHLGWSPAQAVSGREWMLPVLGELMDDPYAAVRCVAERSLKSLIPAGLRGYDFTLDPGASSGREPASRTIWGMLKDSADPAAPGRGTRTKVDLADVGGTAENFRVIKARRVERPLRLRE